MVQLNKLPPFTLFLFSGKKVRVWCYRKTFYSNLSELKLLLIPYITYVVIDITQFSQRDERLLETAAHGTWLSQYLTCNRHRPTSPPPPPPSLSPNLVPPRVKTDFGNVFLFHLICGFPLFSVVFKVLSIVTVLKLVLLYPLAICMAISSLCCHPCYVDVRTA